MMLHATPVKYIELPFSIVSTKSIDEEIIFLSTLDVWLSINKNTKEIEIEQWLLQPKVSTFIYSCNV